MTVEGWRDGHPTMGLLSEQMSATLVQWARIVRHMSDCRECADAWREITGSAFPAAKLGVPSVAN